jgi:voltage-gated potassium channel
MSISSLQIPDKQETAKQKRQLVVNANYELFVLALVILQLVNSALWLLLRNHGEGSVVLLMSIGISIFLLVDCLYRLVRAPVRREYLFTVRGWLLWLGSLPVPFAGLLRLWWYRLVTRNLRRGDYAAMVDVVVEKRAQSTLLVAVFAAIVVIEGAAILVLGAESPSPQANIQTAGDAVWWTIVTVATVGYGDKYPVTPAGRVIGAFVMVVGVGLFSVLTSFLAQWFVRARQAENVNAAAALASVEDVQTLLARLDALNALLEQQGAAQQADAANLRARLAVIENKLDASEPGASETPPSIDNPPLAA